MVWRRIVNTYGPFRQLLTDGAREMVGVIMTNLLADLDAESFQLMPYRLAMMGLVERFSQTLKDMLSMFVNAAQTD